MTPHHRTPLRPRGALAAAGTLLLVSAVRAPAQTASDAWPGPSPRTLACVRSLPDSALRRTLVFLRAEVADSADAAARPVVDLVAQEVAARVRAALWPTPDAATAADAAGRLPAVDSAVGRVYPEGRLRVVATRGGSLRWHLDAPAGADTLPLRMVERALRAAQADGAALVVDELLRGDSLAYELGFVYATPPAPGRAPDTLRVRNAAPVFTAAMPVEKQAAARPGTVKLRYPDRPLAARLEGRVVLEFVVDSMGRAEPGTVHDAQPTAAAALAPELRRAYAQFVQVAREAVLGARFYPAEVGGCRVPQRVRLPLAWTIGS